MSSSVFPVPLSGIQESIIAAKGDLIVGTANDTPGILTVGTDGHILTADSSEATGLKFIAPAGGGKVLQVVTAETGTDTTITGTTFTDTSLTATITPTLNTSKILIFTNSPASINKTNPATFAAAGIRLLRGSTVLQASNIDGGAYILAGTSSPFGVEIKTTMVLNHSDSPATTSATTYKIQMAAQDATTTTRIGFDGSTSTIILMEIGV